MIASLRTTFIGMIMLGGLTATPAWACGYSGKVAASLQEEGAASVLFHQASDTDGEGAIVGMWQFKMMSGGQVADFGYQQWHSDHTEIFNSGGRAPATENFCLGVWREVGERHYHLNHFALSYDTSGTLNAKVNIKEDVILNEAATTYHGTFTLDVYDPKSGAHLAHQAGSVTGARVPMY